MKSRWNKLKEKCSRTQISCVPRTFHHRMVENIGFQGAAYGTNLRHVTGAQWSSLRATLANAIQLSRAGASSRLVLGMFRSTNETPTDLPSVLETFQYTIARV